MTCMKLVVLMHPFVYTMIFLKMWCSFMIYKNGCHFILLWFIISSLVISTLKYHLNGISLFPKLFYLLLFNFIHMFVCSSIWAFFLHNFLYFSGSFWSTVTIFWNFHSTCHCLISFQYIHLPILIVISISRMSTSSSMIYLTMYTETMWSSTCYCNGSFIHGMILS